MTRDRSLLGRLLNCFRDTEPATGRCPKCDAPIAIHSVTVDGEQATAWDCSNGHSGRDVEAVRNGSQAGD